MAVALVIAASISASATRADAQESMRDVLSFLVTNRSVSTGDFARDEVAAAATRDTIAGFLLTEFSTLPVSTSSGGFTYRMDPGLGTVMRTSDSFGPFFAERTLTAGRGHSSLGLSYRTATFDTIDGRDLRDGSLVSTATTLRGEGDPFDEETITLNIRSATVTVVGNYGLTDRLDVSTAIPFVTLTLSGERVDTYRGQQFTQATASAARSGPGDIVVGVKYNVLRSRASGVAVGAVVRLPSGDADSLLGAGHATIKPRLIGSAERARVGLHGDVGYALGDSSAGLDYAGAVTFVVVPRLTLIGEALGRRLESFGRLTETTEPHPGLVGVDTTRLTGVQEATHRILLVAGFKWNVTGAWIVSGHLVRPLTTVGLNGGWVPTVTLDYSFGR